MARADEEHRAGPADLAQSLYGILRELAEGWQRRKGPLVSWQASELVNEAWIRLQSDRGARTDDRARFRAAAASAMRRALVDHAKEKLAAKRGGGAPRVTLHEELALGGELELDVLAVHEALEALGEEDRALARHVEMRSFAGATREDVAEEFGIPLGRVDADWRFAKSWMALRLRGTRE